MPPGVRFRVLVAIDFDVLALVFFRHGVFSFLLESIAHVAHSCKNTLLMTELHVSIVISSVQMHAYATRACFLRVSWSSTFAVLSESTPPLEISLGVFSAHPIR